MRLLAVTIVSAVTLAAGLPARAQSASEVVDAHIAAAKAAAGRDHAGLFNAACAPTSIRPAPAPQRGQRAAGAAVARPGPPDRAVWHVEPEKVFDNLYFVGQSEFSSWAVTTSAGIIVIDTIYDYSVEDEVVGGLTKLGLDPATIKYVIVSHGHADHSGGAKLLQERFGARVILSATDWDLLDRSAGTKPTRDMVATDGQKLTLGDTTLTLYLTPGHTPGTISTLIPVKDNGRPHLVAEWGGTMFNFARSRDAFDTYIASAERFQGIVARAGADAQVYAASAEKFRDVAAKAGADALISNHTRLDGSKTKIPALALRKPGDRHPYVVGTEAVKAYMTVAGECAKAVLAGMK